MAVDPSNIPTSSSLITEDSSTRDEPSGLLPGEKGNIKENADHVSTTDNKDQSTCDEPPGWLLGETVEIEVNKENKEKKEESFFKIVGFMNY